MSKNDSLNGTTLPLRKIRQRESAVPKHRYGRYQIADIISERRFYQKLTDIYATAVDYNKDAPTTRLFYKKVQNKMHYAVHGHTAAELIIERAPIKKYHVILGEVS